MASPPTKRKRTKDATITRSETWRSDGNVVLQAAHTQFRVHWSVLALHSSVFSGMQGLPQPDDQPTVEGCPVVELSDDPQDVEYLLKALYSTTFHCQKTLPLAVVGAFIRLGRKYDFKDLFDSAVTRIAHEFPMTLDKYDTLSEDYETIQGFPESKFEIVSLLSQTSILSALPSAYYCAVAKLDLTELFNGIQASNGTVVKLSSLDLRRCVIGQQKLLTTQFLPGYTFGWARKWEFRDCTDVMRCRTSRENILTELLGGTVLGALALPSDLEYTFCAACTRHVAESMNAGRKKMWDELPGFFELPPWSELKNDM